MIQIAIIAMLAYAWPAGWWPMYGGDAQHTRLQLMKGNMSFVPTVTAIDMTGGSECEGPAIATIGGVSYVFVDNSAGDPDAIAAYRYYLGSYGIAWQWAYANVRSQGTACAVWDIDNDGTIEMLHANIHTSTDVGAVWCRVATTGATDWPGWYGPYDGPDPTSPTLYDVDGNGTTEIFFGDDRLDSLWCLNPTSGAKIWSAPAKNGDYAPAVGQVIPGGNPEVVSNSGDTLIMWNAATGARIATLYLGSVTISSAPAIADVDKDGTMEIFIYTQGPDSLWCLRPSGASFSVLWCQTVPNGGNVNKQGMAIADMNGDGWLDVVIGSGGTAAGYPTLYDRVHCFRGSNGALVWRSDTLAGDVHRGVAIADIDGDNRWEVIAQTIPGWIYCLAGENGAKQWTVDMPSCTDAHDVTIGDTDNDGCSEITLAGDGSNNLWIIDRPGTNCGSVDAAETGPVQNPMSTWFSGDVLHITSPQGGKATVRIYDPVGRTVISRDIRLSEGQNAISLDLEPGVYLGVASYGKETARFKFVVKR